MLDNDEIRFIIGINDKSIEKTLNSLGGNNEIFSFLFSNGYFEKVGDNCYIISDYDSLYDYAVKLVNNGSIDVAVFLFNICFYYSDKNVDSTFFLFLLSIEKSNIESALKYYDILVNSDNGKYVKRANYFLFLCNLIYKLPTKYANIASNFKYKDMGRDYTDEYYCSLQKEIIGHLLNGYYDKAFKSNEYFLKFFISKFESRLTNKLLRILSDSLLDIKKILLDKIRNKNYEEARDIILNVFNGNLINTRFYKNCLTLLNILINYENNHIIPNVKEKGLMSNELFAAIENNDFFIALKLCDGFDKKYDIFNGDNIFYILLDEICRKKVEISNENNQNIGSVSEINDDIVSTKNKVLSLSDENPICILPRMSNDKSNELYDYFKDMDGISITIVPIGSYYKALVVKKNSDYTLDDISYYDYITKEFDDICSYYLKSEFEIALSKLLKLISVCKELDSKYLAMLGNIYISLGLSIQGKELIDISKYMALEEIKVNSLRLLEGHNSFHGNKYFPRENLDDNLEDDFGIQFFGEFNDYIRDNCRTFNEACIDFKLSEEEVVIVSLLMAREYYIKEYYREGDMFVKFADQSKFKNDRIIHLLKVVKKNRKFYRTKASKVIRILNFGLKPKPMK